MNKATRTLGDCPVTLQPPCHPLIFQKPPKNEGNFCTGLDKCQLQETPLSTTKYTPGPKRFQFALSWSFSFGSKG